MSPVTRPVKPGQTTPGAGGLMTGGTLVTVQSSQGAVRGLLGEEGAHITGGYGGWEVTARPRDVAMTTWQGRGPFEMDLPLLLDRFGEDGSVEADCRLLERMAIPVNQKSSPPTVRLIGAVPRAGLRWVVDSIDWGDQLRNIWSGERVRQAVSLHLIEFQAPDLVAPRSKATPQNAKRVKAREGDTLKKIAKRVLGNAKHWKEIRKLNPKFRSPTKKIPKGTSILVPKK